MSGYQGGHHDQYDQGYGQAGHGDGYYQDDQYYDQGQGDHGAHGDHAAPGAPGPPGAHGAQGDGYYDES